MKNYLYLCVDVLCRLLNILSYNVTYLLLHIIDDVIYIFMNNITILEKIIQFYLND